MPGAAKVVKLIAIALSATAFVILSRPTKSGIAACRAGNCIANPAPCKSETKNRCDQ